MWQVFAVPPLWFLVLAAVGGLFVGGWLTLLTHRLPRMMEREWQAQCRESQGQVVAVSAYSLKVPASQCPQCEAPIKGWRQLPLIGWLFLRGRCAACHQPIGWRYPIIELLTMGVFAACAWRYGPTPIALCVMGLSAALIALAWIDYESNFLPDSLTLPLAWAGLLVNLNGALVPLPLAVLGAVAGYSFLWLIFHLFRWLTGRDGMGMGDFKLLAALGAWFGLGALPWILLAASLTGVVLGCLLTLTGRARRGQMLPFGPYLALAGVTVIVLEGPPQWWEHFFH